MEQPASTTGSAKKQGSCGHRAAEGMALEDAHAAAYVWSDLAGSSGSQLGHASRPPKASYTTLASPPALNHQRYAKEVKVGLHEKKAKGRRMRAEGKKRAPQGEFSLE